MLGAIPQVIEQELGMFDARACPPATPLPQEHVAAGVAFSQTEVFPDKFKDALGAPLRPSDVPVGTPAWGDDVPRRQGSGAHPCVCLLYTSDAADEA